MNPIDVEAKFFAALIAADTSSLEKVLTADFIMVALNGSRMTKSELMSLVESRQLQFQTIDRVESDVRTHGNTAVITGRTAMNGSFAGTPFAANSRYTHVFTKDGEWRMMSAQGTVIAD